MCKKLNLPCLCKKKKCGGCDFRKFIYIQIVDGFSQSGFSEFFNLIGNSEYSAIVWKLKSLLNGLFGIYMKFDRIGRSSEFSTRINLTSDELKLSSQNIITINNKKKCGIDFLIIEEYYY
jgi:hypothetical protein